LGFVLLAIVFVLFACVFFPRSIVVLGFVVLDGWFSCVGVLVCLVFCVVLWLWFTYLFCLFLLFEVFAFVFA